MELRALGEDWKKFFYEEVMTEYMSLTDEDRSEIGEDFEDAMMDIMAQYDEYYFDENLEYVEVEKEIRFEFKTSKKAKKTFEFLGYIDGIIKDKDSGDLYIFERKTFGGSPMSIEDTWINVQSCLYVIGARMMGYDVKGIMWDMVKSVPPKPPNVLKNGKLGKQFGTITPYSFKKAGIEVEENSKLENELNKNLSQHLLRYKLPVNDTMLYVVWKDLTRTTQGMVKNRDKSHTIAKHCAWCEFKEICKSELTGGDPQYIKDLGFYVKEKEEEKDGISSKDSNKTIK